MHVRAVVGVSDSVAECAAHARLDFEDGTSPTLGFLELTRVPATS